MSGGRMSDEQISDGQTSDGQMSFELMSYHLLLINPWVPQPVLSVLLHGEDVGGLPLWDSFPYQNMSMTNQP